MPSSTLSTDRVIRSFSASLLFGRGSTFHHSRSRRGITSYDLGGLKNGPRRIINLLGIIIKGFDQQTNATPSGNTQKLLKKPWTVYTHQCRYSFLKIISIYAISLNLFEGLQHKQFHCWSTSSNHTINNILTFQYGVKQKVQNTSSTRSHIFNSSQ